MSEPKTYTLKELADLLKWHESALKVLLRKMNVDPSIPIEEEDAKAAAYKLKRKWPPNA